MVFLNPSTDEVVALPNLLNLLRIPNLLTKFALNLRLIKAPICRQSGAFTTLGVFRVDGLYLSVLPIDEKKVSGSKCAAMTAHS